jgi:hypothetical protein
MAIRKGTPRTRAAASTHRPARKSPTTAASPRKPASVAEYLGALDPERRTMIAAVRDVVLAHLPEGYEETMGWGIMYAVPLAAYPNTYNGQPLAIASICSEKNYATLHLMCAYGDAQTRAWLESEFRKRGKKLDMGKACLRFTSLDDLPLDVIGQAIARVPPDKYIERYEASRRK